MDHFETNIKDYYKDIDLNGFTQFIQTIRDLNKIDYRKDPRGTEFILAGALDRLVFSPNINFNVSLDKIIDEDYQINYIIENKDLIIKELMQIKRNYLIGLSETNSFGTIIENNKKNSILNNESFFKDSNFNKNILALKNNFGIDITTFKLLDKIDINFHEDYSDNTLFSYKFYAEDNSSIEIINYINKLTFEIDKIFNIETNNYLFSLIPSGTHGFAFEFTNLDDNMFKSISISGDDICFSDSYFSNYTETLNPHVGKSFSAIVTYFNNKNTLREAYNNISTNINGKFYNKVFELGDENQLLNKYKTTENEKVKNSIFLDMYDLNFDLTKITSAQTIDILELHDLKCKYRHKYDKLSGPTKNIIQGFEKIRDSSFYTKTVINHNIKNKSKNDI